MAAPNLKSLHAAVVATLSGYKEALEKSEDPALVELCQDMIELRTRHHGEIHPVLENFGETADDGPTLMSKVQETVIDVRAAITGIDKDTLPSFIRGETSIVEKYDEALKEMAGNDSIYALVARQKSEVQAAIREMKAISPAR